MLVHGGFSGMEHLSDTWLFDPRAAQWTQVKCAYTPPPSSSASVVARGEQIFKFFGECASHKSTAYAAVDVFDAGDFLKLFFIYIV
jgi:hypothetical protein